jgi:hypothetical protein
MRTMIVTGSAGLIGSETVEIHPVMKLTAQ